MVRTQEPHGTDAVFSLSMEATPQGEVRPQYSHPDSFAGHRAETIHLSKGMHLALYEFDFSQNMSMQFEYESNPFFFFNFVLQGESSHQFHESRRLDRSPTTGPYFNLFTFEGTGECSLYAPAPIQNLCLGIAQEHMHQLLGDALGVFPKPCQVCSGPLKPSHFQMQDAPLTAPMHAAVHQVLQQRRHTPHDRFLLESRALELLVLFVEDLVARHNSPRSGAAQYIPPQKRDQLHAAKEILQREYVEPPSIAVLARRVGMNVCTLKQLFKATFATTIHGFVRQERMRRAKTMLEEGMTVSAVASRMGYVNTSHFAAAYRKHHGVSPGALKRRKGRRHSV